MMAFDALEPIAASCLIFLIFVSMMSLLMVLWQKLFKKRKIKKKMKTMKNWPKILAEDDSSNTNDEDGSCLSGRNIAAAEILNYIDELEHKLSFALSTEHSNSAGDLDEYVNVAGEAVTNLQQVKHQISSAAFSTCSEDKSTDQLKKELEDLQKMKISLRSQFASLQTAAADLKAKKDEENRTEEYKVVTTTQTEKVITGIDNTDDEFYDLRKDDENEVTEASKVGCDFVLIDKK